MNFDTQVKMVIYRHFAETGRRPSIEDVAEHVGSDVEHVLDAYSRLRAERVLVLEPDGVSIRMAPPFSGVPPSISWMSLEPSISLIVPGTPWVYLLHCNHRAWFTPAASNPASLYT